MTKRKGFIIVLVFVFILSVSLSVFLTLFSRVNKTIAQIFQYDETNVSVEMEKSLSDSFLNGKKGVLFSTQKSNAKISLLNKVAGEFEIEFTPVSTNKGVEDFSTVAFTFKDENSKLGFIVSFFSRDNGVVGAVSLTHMPKLYSNFFVDASFCNVSDKAIKFYFNPYTMQVSNAEKNVVAEFTSEEYMSNFGMTTTLDPFEKYSVDIVCSNIVEGKKAQLLIFDICGQRFDKANIENNTAPIIFDDIKFNNGVINKAYAIPMDISTYDVIDGFNNSFIGEVSVTNDKYQALQVVGNSFVPENSGIYYVNYIPKDSSNLAGEKYSYTIFVFESQPKIEFVHTYLNPSMTVGSGAKVDFGGVYATSLLHYQHLSVSAEIICGQDVVYSQDDCSTGFSYTFNQLGEHKVQFKATDYVGYNKVEEVIINVVDQPIFQNVNLKENYAKDSSINLSHVYLTYNSQVFDSGNVNVLITYPDKSTNTAKMIKLTQEGVYKIEFSAKINGTDLSFVKSFTVKNDSESLWEKQEGLTVTSNAVAPSYADDDYVGTKLTVSRPLEVQFKNVIDISDNTKDDLLTEIFISPNEAGVLETSCIDIILTDVYDSSNVIDIRLTRDVWSRIDKKDMISIIAQPVRDFNDEYLRLIDSKNYAIYYYYTRVLKASLFGNVSNDYGSSPAQSIKLYFDYETGQLYANMAMIGQKTGKLLVADLSDKENVGENNLWKKFTTGEAKLSIKISKLVKDANIMILNIDGQDMAGNFTEDNTLPSIFLDYDGNSESNLPCAVVGKPYSIFSAYARDLVGGTLNNVSVNVYKQTINGLQEMPINAMQFTPDQTGEYLLKYSTSDSSGNYNEKTVRVMAKNANEVSEITYQFSPDILSQLYAGEYFRFYEGVASGGTGKLTCDVKVSLDGEVIALDQDGGFTVEKAGTYKVSVTVYDYLGKSEPFIKDVLVIYSPNAIMQEKTMPKAVVKGETFIIPEFEAFVYDQNGKNSIKPTIKVNGQVITNGEYVPTEEGTITVEISAQGTSFSYDIAVLTSKDKSEEYLNRFFYTNAKISSLPRGMVFTFDQPMTIDVLRKIDVDFLNFVVSSEEVVGAEGEQTIPSGTNLEKIDISLVDSIDKNIKVTFSLIKKDSSESYLEYQGIRYPVKNAAFTSYSKTFVVNFDAKTNQVLIGDMAICKIDKTDSGKRFNGFTSREVYLSFAATTTGGKAAIGINNIAGQFFNNTVKIDRTGPELQVLGDFPEVKYGQTLVVPKATAFDFISGVKSIVVTVQSPSNAVILKNVDITTDKEFVINEYGKYKIRYTATDGNGEIKEKNYTVSVLDYTPPTITLLGDIVEVVRVGEEVELPDMQVTDDNSTEEQIKKYIYIIMPNAEMRIITDGKFVPETKGDYLVIYFAADSDNATAIERFTVYVR